MSEKLIGCAVKTRITLDFLKDEDQAVDLSTEDREICKRHELGRLKGDSVSLCIREVCNKVIHTESVSPDIEACDGECERWNGWLYLHGARGNAKWTLHLDLAAFCLALEEMIFFLEESYDWHHVYKYD